MAEATKAFRTITRASVAYKTNANTYIPIPLPMAPQNASLKPGVSIQRLQEKGLQGPMQSVLTYDEQRQPTITLEFAAASLPLESLITGRTVEADTNYTAFVYYNVRATATTLAARPNTEYTYYVEEQTATGALANGTLAWYISDTGLQIPLTVIDYAGTPSGNQIAIGDALALKLPSTLVDDEVEIYIKVPAEFPSVIRMTATPIVECWITLWGISFGGDSVRIINARNCSPNLNTDIAAEPQRSLEFEILTDSTASSDLGYDMIDVPLAIKV